MGKNMMEAAQTAEFLEKAQAGVFCTLGQDGYPYGVPVQFIYENGTVYFHCGEKGEKLANLDVSGKVCFTVYELGGLAYSLEAKYMCGINTEYLCAVVRGQAAIVQDDAERERALRLIVQKYAPEMSGKPMKDTIFRKTAVVAIKADSITGKSYESKRPTT